MNASAVTAALFVIVVVAPSARAQHDESMDHMDMDHMDHMNMSHAAPATSADHPDHSMNMMSGMLGDYSMTREASGTSWQPQSTPMAGKHFMLGDWMMMAHGFIDIIYDSAGGERGD